MKAVFNHDEDFFGNLDGVPVHNPEELFALLGSFTGREPFIGNLVGENGYKLTLGIGNDVGCVQHSPSDGNIPYLMALAPEKGGEDEYVEFLLGGTSTPISKRYCLSFETVKHIAAFFIETGKRSPAVSWEEI